MPKKTKKTMTMVIPGAETEEGRARIANLAEERNTCDYRAYQLLTRLRDDGLLYPNDLKRALISQGESKRDAEEIVDEILEELRSIVRDRRDAEHNLLNALAGRE